MCILNFLGKFKENSLMADVNMYIDHNYELDENEDLPRALTKIAPFITSIDSINTLGFNLFKIVYNNNDEANKSQLRLKEMMAKTRILVTDR
jgi:hypothetical protein